ncbi:LysR family transcriptional repressor of citA [Sinobaca qinghaiensis]|uniref:LysR family transcriptional repressor of citA n=1 Tax=Sinobaca qinghaiensis TaxID=342944 RepID=A0A419UWG3_9BACL|nr:LysR family transcriptional regulator [Sinobaca qinghaiensis]RKD69464.1 LysR family transcriptional repressor of citA [Sinobaca qinghaiensis]
MNTQWLRTFLTAAKQENYHQTAELLFMSQPAVSVQMKQLERELGVFLFERNGRNVRLTTYGRYFYPKAVQIIKELDEGFMEMQRIKQGYYQTLTIAVSPLVATTYLPYWLKAYVKKEKQVDVVIRVMESELIAEEINKGLSDIGLSRMDSQIKGVTASRIFEEPLKVVAPHDGGEEESSLPIEFRSLIEEKVLLTDNHPEYWEPILRQLHFAYPALRTMKVSQVHVAKRFIEEDIGFSILPRSAVRRELAEGRMLEIDAPELLLPMASTYILSKYPQKQAITFETTIRRLV